MQNSANKGKCVRHASDRRLLKWRHGLRADAERSLLQRELMHKRRRILESLRAAGRAVVNFPANSITLSPRVAVIKGISAAKC